MTKILNIKLLRMILNKYVAYKNLLRQIHLESSNIIKSLRDPPWKH